MILGKNIETGQDFEITPEERKVHMHVMGASGRGKSKFLEMMIQKDIWNGEGLCLLDPHGSLYNNITKWIETHNLWDKRKVILFDPLEERYSFAFNPLKLSESNIASVVDAMIKACATVWGGEDPNRLPLLQKSLTGVFHTLIEKRLSLYESLHLIDTADPSIRLYLTHDIEDPTAFEIWKDFNKKSVRDLDNDFLSVKNRLTKFLRSDIIRCILGQIKDTIDFYKIMEEGHILLVNLNPSNKLSLESTRLLGALIINELYLNCLRRKEDEARPFYLYVDEAGNYVTEDIPLILEQGRKFGLHSILSHQHLFQLQRNIGMDGFKSVMSGGQTKVIFGGMDYEDAKIMVDNVFAATGQINMQEWKLALTRPTVVGYERTTFKNYSVGHGRSSGKSRSTSRGTASIRGYGESETFKPGQQTFMPGGLIITGSSSFESESQSFSEGSGDFISESESESEGYSEGLEPIMEHLSIKEYSLEEQKERAIALLAQQPVQHAIMKLPSKKSQFVKIPDAEIPWALDERVKKSKEKKYLSTQYIKARHLIEQEIIDRQKSLKQEARKFIELQKANKSAIEAKPTEPIEKQEEEKETFKEKRVRHKKI